MYSHKRKMSLNSQSQKFKNNKSLSVLFPRLIQKKMNIQITHGHTFPSLFTGYFYYTSSSSQSPNNSPISNLSRNSSNSLLLFSLTDLGSTVQEVNQEEEGLKMIVNVLQASLEEKKSLLRVLYSGKFSKFRRSFFFFLLTLILIFFFLIFIT